MNSTFRFVGSMPILIATVCLGAPATQPTTRATLDALTASPWVCSGRRNILGQGTDEILTFREAGGVLAVDRTYRTFPSVNDKSAAGRVVEKTTTLPASVDGPLLRLGEADPTFAIIPGKQLVLRAVVPLGNGQWYYNSGTVNKLGKVAGGGEVMWLNFADDPLTRDAGNGTIRVRTNNGASRQDIHFTVTVRRNPPAGERIVDVILDDPKHAKWAQILFPAGGAYGLRLDAPNANSQVFVPRKPGNEK